MSNLLSENPLELEVLNFGPIAKAKVKLRPLTVFVGPSNTGKSYLAILTYALHQFFSDVAFALHNNWTEISSRVGKSQ